MSTRRNFFLGLIPILIAAISLYNCTGKNNGTHEGAEVNNENSEGVEKSFTEFKENKKSRQFLNEEIEAYLKQFPSPTEVLFKMKSSGLILNKTLINDFNNYNSYLIHSDITATNLGIYASDIAYLSAYDQLQDVINYLNVCRQMSDHLGVTSAFEIKIIEEFKENFGDKKKIEGLINKSIKSTADILRTDERTETAILLLAGAYIEGLYVSSHIISPEHMASSDALALVLEQEKSMDGLISLLNELEPSNRTDDLISSFKKLKKSYQAIIIEKNDQNINQNTLAAFSLEVNQIRNKMIAY